MYPFRTENYPVIITHVAECMLSSFSMQSNNSMGRFLVDIWLDSSLVLERKTRGI